MAVLIVVVSFVVMEAVTWAVHRYVMHGPGWFLHASHHRDDVRRYEANDLYPVMFALVVLIAMWVGFHDPRYAFLVPIGIGVTLYGFVYALVHDGFVHRRFWMPRRCPRIVERLVEAHRVHHRTGGEPFGMLAPYVPYVPKVPGEQRPTAVEPSRSH